MTDNSLENKNLPDRVKLLRIGRLFIFIVLYALAEVALAHVIPADLRTEIRASRSLTSLVILVMIAIDMLLIYIGGGNFLTIWNAEWKEQLSGLISFFLSMQIAKGIAMLLYGILPIESSNEGVLSLVMFAYFVVGLLIILPLQYIPMRAYAKRRGIPIWPNLPKE